MFNWLLKLLFLVSDKASSDINMIPKVHTVHVMITYMDLYLQGRIQGGVRTPPPPQGSDNHKAR